MQTAIIDPQTIFKYDSGKNIPWNISQYQPVRQYFDHHQKHQQQKRKNGQTIPTPYVTKRGSFLDGQIKYFVNNPAPCKYQNKSIFDQTQNKKEGRKHPIDFKLKKNTYLEQIQSQEKRHKTPSVGKYNLSFSQSKKSHSLKKKKQQHKRFFYQDFQFLSMTNPGSGAYNPHDSVLHIKNQRFDHKFWIQKHLKQAKRDRARNLKKPDTGTYTPLNISLNSFDKIKFYHDKLQKKNKSQSQKKHAPFHGFGSCDTKFKYEKKSKIKIVEQRPDPCNYNTMIQWKGKGQDTKRTWVRCLSAGPKNGIYH